MNLRQFSVPFFVCTLLVSLLAAGCGERKDTEPPVATPSFSVNHPRAALGSPVEITYKFVVAPDAPKFQENFRVMVHFLDVDEELMWTDDHNPDKPTTEWKPLFDSAPMHLLFTCPAP